MSKALIAMSGGVDSSVAAFLTKQSGYECIGVTMKLYTNEEIGVCKENSCCSLSDIEDARSVACKLLIPYYVFNFKADFEKHVIKKFVEDYENGATPNPCINCNRYLKFESLFHRAKEIGCEKIITGHYARVEKDELSGRYLLKKAYDETKDQSYVLYTMTQQQLAHTEFPLGTLNKTKVREIALENNFINAKKHDSQDICFVPDKDYVKFIENYTQKIYPFGNFTDKDGKILGEHKGLIRYTVGQRKGLGLSFDSLRYVCEINIKNNNIVLGEEKDLYSKSFDVVDYNLISRDSIDVSLKVKAKIRYRHKEQWATVSQKDKNTLHVEFDQPQRAVTKGQAVVFYDDDIVVGGGTILI